MARLVGCTVEDLQADRIGIATDFAKRHKLYVVLKGYRTIVVEPDGRCSSIRPAVPAWRPAAPATCWPACSRAWLAQLLDAEAACRLAVYLHGSAGELADADNGEVSMTAGDLVDHIGDAILELTARRRVVASKSRVSPALSPRTPKARRARSRPALAAGARGRARGAVVR